MLLEHKRPTADKEKSLAWLCSSGRKGETESLMIAAQDQALNVLSSQEYYEQPTDSKCKMRSKAEHIKHIVARHTTLAPSDNNKTQ